MTALLQCSVPTFQQTVLPVCHLTASLIPPITLIIQLLQQLIVSKPNNECAKLLFELGNERLRRRETNNTRRVLELQCLLQIQMELRLRTLQQERKEYEEKLKKLQSQIDLEQEQAEGRIESFIEHWELDEDPSELNPIMMIYAAKFGSLQLLSRLLSLGFDVNSPWLDGTTPLHMAAQGGQTETVKLLIERGADVTAKNEDNETPLHEAAAGGSLEVLAMLLANGSGSDINALTKKKETPVLLAALNGRLASVKMLIEHGANVNIRDKDEDNALTAAAALEKVDVVCWLMQNANINIKDNLEDPNPLNFAIALDNLELVRCLVENGFPVNLLVDMTPPLTLAAAKGNLGIAELLIKHGANVDQEDDDGATALHIAAKRGHLKVVRLLVEHGADYLASDLEGRTAEGVAKRSNHRHVEEFLRNVRINGL